MRKPLADFFAPPVRLDALAPQSDHTATPEQIEARLRGLVKLANPSMFGLELRNEQDQVVGAYRRGGPLARTLRRFLVGEVAEQRRRLARDDTSAKIDACVRALALSAADAEREWRLVSHLRPSGKRGKPTDDRYVMAVCWYEPECQDKAAAAKRYRTLYRRHSRQAS